MNRTLFLKKTKRVLTETFVFLALFHLAADEKNDETLLEEFIQSKGYSISFDASNIKQFWVSHDVLSMDNSIKVCLSQKSGAILESLPLKIQLAHVNEQQNCKIDIYTENPDFSFSVLDSSSKTIAESSPEDDFLHYCIKSATYHVEDTNDYSFYLKFKSNQSDISLKKIVLSFSKNNDSNYVFTPGIIKCNIDDIGINSKNTTATSPDENTIAITGIHSQISTKKSIILTDKTITTSATIRNTGDSKLFLYYGFIVYSQDKTLLTGKHYPYTENNKVLTVLSSQKDSDTIVVDCYSDWRKECLLAIDVKDDMSDIPYSSFADGTILDVKEQENGSAEIKMSKPLKEQLEKGTKVRIHGRSGAFLYTHTTTLQPGEEKVLSSSISKDDNYYLYTKNAFPHGAYCIKPVILSISVNEKDKEINTILISDYTISY